MLRPKHISKLSLKIKAAIVMRKKVDNKLLLFIIKEKLDNNARL